MKIYGVADGNALFIVERNGEFTHDDWPCDQAKAKALIADGSFREITRREAERRILRLGPHAAYWPLPEESN